MKLIKARNMIMKKLRSWFFPTSQEVEEYDEEVASNTSNNQLNISTTSNNQFNRSPSSSSLFTWHQMLLGISFGIPVALLSVSYDYAEGFLVPTKLFASSPKIFQVFITLDALSFTASVIGLQLQSTVHKRASKYLGVFAFACLMLAFYTVIWVLFPSYLKWLPFLLLSMVLVVFIYIYTFPQTSEMVLYFRPPGREPRQQIQAP